MILRENYFTEESRSKDYCSFNSTEKSNIVQTIIAYMKENYAEEISLSKMSKSTYLSPVYISKIFKEETGFSPINYLINIRLEKAKEMLEKGRITIKDVAKNVGYEDAYYFSKLFKKYYGYPPSRIIQQQAAAGLYTKKTH
jgi:transcriptional regulator, AraC family